MKEDLMMSNNAPVFASVTSVWSMDTLSKPAMPPILSVKSIRYVASRLAIAINCLAVHLLYVCYASKDVNKGVMSQF